MKGVNNRQKKHTEKTAAVTHAKMDAETILSDGIFSENRMETGLAEGALPEEFCRRMKSLLPEDEYQAFLSSYGRKRLFSLRLNPLKCSIEDGRRLLEAAAEEAAGYGSLPESVLTPVPWEPSGFYYPEAFRPGRLPWHEAGMYYIQEASAMAPARLCGAQPGDRVLDLCAAPGGKSTKLAADLDGQGLLVANEIHSDRAKVLSANLERMGVRNALVTNASPQELASRFPLFFDRIVVDAPCSGEGMFRKEEAALLHWSLENVRMCADRQGQILEEAASMLRPGGTLVYSTCTFSPEENEGTIAAFLDRHPEFTPVPASQIPGIRPDEWRFAPGRPEWGEEMLPPASSRISGLEGSVRLWPHRLDGEGHFAAVLRKADRSGSGGPEDGKKRRGRKGGGKKGRRADPKAEELLRLWEKFRAETLSCSPVREKAENGEKGKNIETWDWQENLFCFGETLYALPVPADSLSLQGLRVLRAGLQLGTAVKGRFIPSHSLGMALRAEEVCRAVDFSGQSDAAYAWLRGEAVPLPPEAGSMKGWVLVTIDGCAAGWGKAAGSMLKNHYPKGLRRGSGYRREQ